MSACSRARVADAALLAEVMAGFDDEDPDTRAACAAAVRRRRREAQPPLPPRFAFVRSPAWKHAETVTQEAFAELVDALGEHVTEVEIGQSFERVIDMHRTVMEVEMAHNLHRDFEQGGEVSEQGAARADRARAQGCSPSTTPRRSPAARGLTRRWTACSTSTMRSSRRRRRARRRAGSTRPATRRSARCGPISARRR